MSTGIERRRGGDRRTLATLASVVLVAAQLIVTAHFHQARALTELSVSNADVVCAVCVLRTHAPAASIGTVAPFVPALFNSPAIPALAVGSLAPRLLRLFGRAPPASR